MAEGVGTGAGCLNEQAAASCTAAHVAAPGLQAARLPAASLTVTRHPWPQVHREGRPHAARHPPHLRLLGQGKARPLLFLLVFPSPACLPACLPACQPACLPSCVRSCFCGGGVSGGGGDGVCGLAGRAPRLPTRLPACLPDLPAHAAQDTIFHGRFSLNVPARMVEYRWVRYSSTTVPLAAGPSEVAGTVAPMCFAGRRPAGHRRASIWTET